MLPSFAPLNDENRRGSMDGIKKRTPERALERAAAKFLPLLGYAAMRAFIQLLLL